MTDTVKISKHLRKNNGHRISARLPGINPALVSLQDKELASELQEMQTINIKSEKLIKQLTLQLGESDSLKACMASYADKVQYRFIIKY
jgi:hypothetical protein